MNQNSLVQIAPPQSEEGDLIRYLDILLSSRWLITGIAIAVLILGVAYSFMATPIYEADIIIQVEDNPNSAKSLLGDVSTLFDVKTEAAAEIEILRSRMVVGKAVDNLRLFIDAKPKYFPLIGERLARGEKSLSTPGVFGLGGYLWGAEKIDVSVFDVPEALEGEKFQLIALGNGKFRLEQAALKRPIEGVVGKKLEVNEEIGRINIFVNELSASPGGSFNLTRKSQLKAVQDLQDDLKITEKGKQSGIIGAALQGADRNLTAAILNEIGSEYVAQNVRRKAAEAEKSLIFLGNLLPALKKELELAELKYNSMRNKHGTFNLSEEGKAYLQESVTLQTSLLELKQKRVELATRFAAGHPSLLALDQQIAALTAKANEVAKQVKSLPDVEQDTLRLTRDVQVNNDLYVGLLNNMQQLKLVKAAKVGNVRLVDNARIPEEPVKPKKILLIPISMLLGLIAGVGAAFFRNSLFGGGITDVHDIERHTGLNVYATVPLSRAQAECAQAIRTQKDGQHLLAQRYPNEVSVESLRSLRTAVQFAMLDAPNNRVLLTGPTPGVGKSFVSANLAAVMAAGGKRILLIDADLRKGYLNQYFGKGREPGLSDVIAGKVSIDDALHRNVVEGLDFLGTGTLPPNPSELLLNKKLISLLDRFSADYDVVLIDTPPVLAVSDAAIVAAICGAVFLVARFDQTSIREVAESAKHLQQSRVEVKGVIFNGLDLKTLRYGYGSKYGKYRYAYYSYSD